MVCRRYTRRGWCTGTRVGGLGFKVGTSSQMRSSAWMEWMRRRPGGVQALHKAGLVHRDVKPANIVLSEAERRFKLIDLGACADLRSGTNYIPDESILDPMYCPPEQVCLGGCLAGAAGSAFCQPNQRPSCQRHAQGPDPCSPELQP